MRVLGIETSCDETGVAIYDSDQGLMADALYSQVEVHAANDSHLVSDLRNPQLTAPGFDVKAEAFTMTWQPLRSNGDRSTSCLPFLTSSDGPLPFFAGL